MTRKNHTPPVPVAIIGLGAVMPDANDLGAFWHNIKTGRDSIREVPQDRWLPEDHYDPDPKAADKSYCKIGSWITGFDFDPLGFRIPPKVAAAMDPVQKWVVEATRQALADAGYDRKDFDRNRTAVIIGNALAGELQHVTNHRVYLPRYIRQLRSTRAFRELPEESRQALIAQFESAFTADIPEITEDSMPGELGNCIAGRVANVFSLRGPNYTADAACASSLAALESALAGLSEGRFDLVVTGGSDSSMSPHCFVKFCKVGALSAELSCPFDRRANGFVMGEGCGILLLKRLQDAERDGDKIYAVIRGMGSSSDGRGKGITAPNPAGQKLAIERAYQSTGIHPREIGLLEAHGTSTAAGDRVEGNLACEFFGEAGVEPGAIAMGSVKSQIGHLKSAAGAAALIKAALSIHEGIIPASLHFEEPNPDIPFDQAPVYVPTAGRPWETSDGRPRLAGVSSFGFGGANFHAVLGEYRPQGNKAFTVPSGGKEKEREKDTMTTDTRVLAAGGETPDGLRREIEKRLARPREQDTDLPPPEILKAAERILITHSNDKERSTRAQRVLKALESDQAEAWRALSNQGVFRGRGRRFKIAFLFPGQGSQYINMLKELREHEPLVAEAFHKADDIMTPLLGRPLTSFIYTQDTPEACEALKDTNVCQPAMLTADVAIARLLEKHGVVPDMVAGHSLGEYAALVVSGMLSFDEALHAVSARAREMSSVRVDDPGKMAAVLAPAEKIHELIQDIDGVAPANFNSRNQTVIGGGSAAVEKALERIKAEGIRAVRLRVSHAFHSHIVAPAVGPLRRMLDKFDFRPPRIPLVANVDAQPYDPDPGAVPANLDRLARQIASPVRFVESLETMHRLGARLFVEVGAKRVLANFVTDVLADPEVVSVATNSPKRGDWGSIQNALAACAAAGPREPVSTAPVIEVHPSEPVGTDVVISGVGLGLPGDDRPVFDQDNTDRILEGRSGIGPVPEENRRQLAGQRVVRLVKDAPGGPMFEVLESPEEVVQLAGRRGTFDLSTEFGLDPKRVQSYDVTTQLAIAAGLLALKDAGVPLVMHHRQTTTGKALPVGYRLPERLADETGVIFASAFPGIDCLVGQMNQRHRDDLFDARIAELEDLAETLGPLHAVQQRLEALKKERGERYSLNRNFIFQVLNFGHAQMAELIGARGPNTGINAACASTTQALIIASDWIRLGRCRRVLVVGADDITNQNLFPWLTAGLFATGAVTTEADLENAALPFDRRRKGMICGMGAVGLVVEEAGLCRERGMTALVRLLGSLVANSAHHGTRLNLDHIAGCMERLVSRVEREHGLDRRDFAKKTVFISHETYTPARGGSAGAEVHSLRKTFGADADRIVIANTKGYTGHPMGVGIEDAVGVRILEHQIVPPIPNHREEDPELGPLNLSQGGHHDVHYALRLAAGFGSQVAMTFTEKIADAGDRVFDRAVNQAWLEKVSGITGARLEVVNKTLRIKESTATTPAPEPVVQPVPMHEPGDSQPPSQFEGEHEPEPEPEKPDVDIDSIKDRILTIVSEKTGYPTDMLDLELDLEADLGIDTVKQAEMFSEIRAAFGIPKQDDLKLSDYPTLNHVIGFAKEKMGANVEVASENEDDHDQDHENVDVESVKDKILTIVSEKTGYPTDMLDLELDLEADLGIDTVKQAEMFSEIRAAFGIPKQDDLKLSDYPTLNHVIGFAREKMGAEPVEEETEEEVPAVEPLGSVSAESETVRYLAPVLVGRPRARECLPTGVEPDGRSLVIGDFNGIAAALEKELRGRGGEPVVISDSGDPDEVAERIGQACKLSPPRGVWVLSALSEPVTPDSEDTRGFKSAVDQRARMPFRAAKVLNEYLAGGGFFICATRMGGHLGLRPGGGSLDPAAGATTGLVKALSREWTRTLCKVVDFPEDVDAGTVAATLIEEVERDGGVTEVGRRGIRRWGVGLSEFTPPQDPAVQLPEDPVVLVTGGAGDITGKIAADLAGHFGGTYYLADLVPAPAQDDADVRTLSQDREAFKTTLIERLKQKGERVTPVVVEKALRQVERKAVAARNLQEVNSRGGRAHSLAFDVTDTQAVEQAVAKITKAHGRIDLILHAAGLEHSQGIAKKTRESFDLILGVKVFGLHALLRATRDVPVKGIMLFGSIAGRFGNAGQTDYSAANDLLSKTTTWLRRTRPDLQVFTLAFSGWDTVGMATRGSVPKQLAAVGINLIPLEEGAASVRRVFESGHSGELVVARSLGALARTLKAPGVDLELVRERLAENSQRYPLLGDVLDWTLSDGLRLKVGFDPSRDQYLDDHRIDGLPVLPGVMAVETFAEAACLMRPDLSVVAVEDLSFDAPLKFYRDEPRTATVRMLPTWDGKGRLILATMETTRELHGGKRQTTRHFCAKVRLDQDLPEVRLEPPGNGDSRRISREAIYRAYFHGPSFQVLDQVTATSEGSVSGWMRSGTESPPLARPGDLSAAPMLAELAFQAAGIVEASSSQKLGLPAGVRKMKIHRVPEGERGKITARVVPQNGNQDQRYNVQVMDERGFMLVELDGYRTSPLPNTLPEDVRSGLRLEEDDQ